MAANRMKILVIDVGGTHVKVLATGHKQRVEFPSGPKMTPRKDGRRSTRSDGRLEI
jgi:polyphosphate glucokinase